MRPFFVYLLRCADDSYYVGHSDDLEHRIAQHQAGEIAGCYTHGRRPVELVWSQETAGRDEALAAELRIKGWSRAKKDALVAGDWERVSELAHRHGAGASTSSARTDPVSARTDAGSDRTDAGSARTDASPFALSLSKGGAGDGRGGASTGSARTGERSAPTGERSARTGEGRAGELPDADRSLLDLLLAPPGPSQRRAIAKAITLLESTRDDHRARGDALLNALLPHTGRSLRLGVSGVPGVGKSTFIEALGVMLVERGHRVAVLAVDPSSSVSGGSILGDKTRMERLSVDPRAFIRPSPSSGTLGGVAEKTRECLLVLEAAGHDIVIVETVGVGQSETAVAGMTDLFVLLQLPNAGDDLQAIKKGVMELADLVAINKADLDAAAATRAQAQITSALRLFGLHGHPDHAHHDDDVWQPRVLQLSALKATGLSEFWDAVERFRALQTANGRLAARRRRQDQAWMWERIETGLQARFRQHAKVREALPGVAEAVRAGTLAPSVAARRLLDLAGE